MQHSFAPETAARPLRFLRIIASVDPATGGPIEGVLRSSQALKRLGHETDIATFDDPKDDRIASVPFKVHALGPRLMRYGFAPRLVPWLRRNASRYDAVFAHGLWNYTTAATWRGLARKRTPYFVFTHGMLDPWFRRHYPMKHWAKQAFWLGIEGRVLRDARAVLFTTEEERLLARTAYRGFSFRERVVAYGTADVEGDADRQIAKFRAAVPDLGNRPYLLFLSRIHPKKGCDVLLQAFARVADDRPEMCLVMAGPDQIGWAVKELRQMADALGIGGRVFWPGMLSGDTKWGAMRAARAFVLPSHSENFGIVVAEATACATPVVITDKVNIWREIDQGGAGFVGSDDVEGFASVLARCLSLDERDRSEMGKRARAVFLQSFHVDKAARDLVALTEEVKPENVRRNSGCKGANWPSATDS